MKDRTTSDERGALAFAEKVLLLFDQGQFNATYKYAVLLALIDLCMENADSRGVPPDMITTRQLAEKVLQLYWPHTAPYPLGKASGILSQNQGGQAEILSKIVAFRKGLADDPLAPIHRARHAAPKKFEELVRTVEWKLIEMPLPRLQVVGGEENRIIYDINWGQDIHSKTVCNYQHDLDLVFDNRIQFRPNVGEYLVRLSGLLRPLVHRHWSFMVARLNELEESKLESFLFGVERMSTEVLRPGLRDIQNDRCFYCRKALDRRSAIDHFIPWSRYPDNGIDNLVLCHEKCNQAKRDFLAASDHVSRWRERAEEPVLTEVARHAKWERYDTATLGVARTLYLGLPVDAKLWQEGRKFVEPDQEVLRTALG